MSVLFRVSQITTDPTPYKIYGLTLQPVDSLLVSIPLEDELEMVQMNEEGTEFAQVATLEQFFTLLNTLGVSCEVAHGYMKRDAYAQMKESQLVS